ncbi:carboxypeptidase-like regulatory domain-containing protein [Niabella hirudinis]|uniref:carboxypeptidase-like regulatory domain-containing protein n=1 Tax=Niabella hirudinis TaxID=1285929 RepID=UPI003EBE0978
MKRALPVIFCLLVLSSAAQQILGTVVDANTHKPLQGASVYFNNTSSGTVTASDGSFTLTEAFSGELIVSNIGYETWVHTIKPNTALPRLLFELKPKVKELENIVVGGYITETWEKWGKVFLETFLGVTPVGRNCLLLNKKALRFRFYKKQNVLEVVADAPLNIENPKLGYNLRYDLLDFKINFSEHSSYYAGFVFFSEQRSGLKRSVLRNRRDMYYGSPMHFMRALFMNKAEEEGFRMKKMTRAWNAEKERVKQLKRKINGQWMADSIPRDSAAYYDQVMRQEDYEDRYADHNLTADSVLTGMNGAHKVIYWNNFLAITYLKGKEPVEYLQYTGERRGPLYPRSWLQLKGPLSVDARGNWSPPQNIISSGYWGWSDKVGNMLPLDYEP